ncbi:MAG: hypothetical protein JW919_01355 [Candidatus Omnitrophica bacterium]|nr:hypothetical protein [Candidatus Omnitrophota bacterium]
MKILNFALAVLLTASFCLAEEAALTGKDYLKLAKRQRLERAGDLIFDAKRAGVTIKKAPSFYCEKLDVFYKKHPDMVKEPLAVVLKTLIIIEYDWQQKGVDKDKLAREWLGEESYKANKARLRK